jgi:hypothetical protein
MWLFLKGLFSKTIRLKRKSLKKWEKIVSDLRLENPRLQTGKTLYLGRWDCGYCILYYEKDCKNCCLNNKELCYGGEGSAYSNVYCYYRNYSVGKTFALEGAIAIRDAIKEDLLVF